MEQTFVKLILKVNLNPHHSFYKFLITNLIYSINSQLQAKIMKKIVCLIIAVLMIEGTYSIRIVHSSSRNHIQWSHERLIERHNDHVSKTHLSLVETSNGHFVFVKGNRHEEKSLIQKNHVAGKKQQLKDEERENHDTVTQQKKHKNDSESGQNNANTIDQLTKSESLDTKISTLSNTTKYTTFVSELDTEPVRNWEIIDRRSIPFHNIKEIERFNPSSIPSLDTASIEVLNPKMFQSSAHKLSSSKELS